MRDVLTQLLPWWESGGVVGVGTVVATFQSAPRPAGASMLVGPDGVAVGSVSGGCVEGAVYELAQQVLGDRQPVLQRYGVSDETAFSVGLTCGGILDVFVEVVSSGRSRSSAPVARAIENSSRSLSRPSWRTSIRRGWGAGWWSGRRVMPHRSRAPWGPIVPATRSPPTPAVCWRPDATRPCTTGRTVSVEARGWRSSLPHTRPSRGCSCSARSTSRPQWLGRNRSSSHALR